ncbi:hypothetical protein [Rufibacter immobilis]|uniref:hypothetical protein n=1 Tax=Rufibacter immobilis TaxID=1348778 RepID=UPI0035EAD0B2
MIIVHEQNLHQCLIEILDILKVDPHVKLSTHKPRRNAKNPIKGTEIRGRLTPDGDLLIYLVTGELEEKVLGARGKALFEGHYYVDVRELTCILTREKRKSFIFQMVAT